MHRRSVIQFPGIESTREQRPLSQVWLATVLVLGCMSCPGAVEAAPESHELLRLLPPRSCVIVTVDDLSGQVRDLLASRMTAELRALPAVTAWFKSQKYRDLVAAQTQIEHLLQVPLTKIRDLILGSAVVLALEIPPESRADPAGARGLLILKARDPALLEKVIETLNTIQKSNGEVVDIEVRDHRDKKYFVRTFPAGSSRRVEAYVMFRDGTFAISNHVETIRQVIDGKLDNSAESANLPASDSAVAGFLALHRRLPGSAVARLFINPRFLAPLIKDSLTPSSTALALFEEHVADLESAGAALFWRDGRVAVEIAEVFRRREPSTHRTEGAETRSPGPPETRELGQNPKTSLVGGEARLNFSRLYQVLIGLSSEADKPQLEKIETALTGLLLGQDFRSRILPNIGPRVLAFADTNEEKEGQRHRSNGPGSPPSELPLNAVMVLELQSSSRPYPINSGTTGAEPSVEAAVDNALTTFLALAGLDEHSEMHTARLVSRQVNGLTIKSLDPPYLFAFAVDQARHRLIVGNSAAAIQRFLDGPNTTPAAGIHLPRKFAFADAESFVCLDLAAVRAYIAKHRAAIVELIARRESRPREEVISDLENAAALARLFEIAFWAHRWEPTSTTSFHTFALQTNRAESRN